MSLSYTSRVVCGWRLDVEQVQVEKTKYNEDTGAPYTVQQVGHRQASVEGKPLFTDKENPDIFDEGGFDGLAVYAAGYEPGDRFIGESVVTVDGNANTGYPFATGVPRVVRDFAERHALKAPSFFLVPSCG